MKSLGFLFGLFFLIDCNSFAFWDFTRLYIDGVPVDYLFELENPLILGVENLGNLHCTLLQHEPRGDGWIFENPLDIDLGEEYAGPEECRIDIRTGLPH